MGVLARLATFATVVVGNGATALVGKSVPGAAQATRINIRIIVIKVFFILFHRHCEKGALPDEAISRKLEIASSQEQGRSSQRHEILQISKLRINS